MILKPKEKNSYEDEEVIPNEGDLLEYYWGQQKREMTIKIIVCCFLFLPVGVYFLIQLLKRKKVYLQLTDLVTEGNQKERIRMIERSSPFEVITVMMGIYALADTKSNSLEEIIRSFLEDMGVNTTLKKAFVRQRCNYLLGYLERSEESEGEKKEAIEEAETIIPITKIFFVEEVKEEKCMITGIRLDVEGDKIVVCPKCRHYAKKDLLEKWLKEKEKCPICRNRITITDCPEVMIKERK